jgi:DNA-binding LacI/PurR family transcriptional regulator
MLAKVQRAYEQRGIAVLPLSVDEPEQESKIAPMLKEYGFKGPFYVATRPLDEIKAALSAEWPGNIPVSFLLDGSGNGKYFFTAQVYENELTPKLDLYLRGALEVGKSNFGVAPGKTF